MVGWPTCGQEGSTSLHMDSWGVRQAEEEAPQPAARWLLAGDPLYRTTTSPRWEMHIIHKFTSGLQSSPGQSQCTHSPIAAPASAEKHLGASQDWRETGHLKMVSPSSGTQKNWNLLGKKYEMVVIQGGEEQLYLRERFRQRRVKNKS